MFIRLKYSTFTLATVVAAYLLYRLVVVPFVEPSVKLAARSTTSARPPARTRKLDHLFPPGSWELERPKVIETDQGTLLFDDYQPLPDGRLELTRCTLIYYIEHAAAANREHGVDEAAQRRPIVLRAPQGATLIFDRTLDVIRGQFGRLVGGRLNGNITIQSPESEPERNDVIDIVTRNVQLDAEKIWTPHEVRFRYGTHEGAGRGLAMYLSRTANSDRQETGLGVGGLRELELLHLDRLQLQMNDSGLFGRSSPATTSRSASKAVEKQPEHATPVAVKCRGPFRFDFEQQLMTLEDHVDLMRHHTNGTSDQLLCQLLEVHFSKGASPLADAAVSPAPPAQRSLTKLEPTKVIASGYPVIIRAASVGVETGAERIEYDCILRKVWLKGRDRVMFKDRQREIEAKELDYGLGDKGRLGDLSATGPGVVRSVGESTQSWQVTWSDQVKLRRDEGTPVLSFNSRVKITLASTGEFNADTLHLYLKETPQAGDAEKIRVELDRLHALGNVTIDSNKLSGSVREVRLWFRSPPGDAHSTAAAKDGGASTPVPGQGVLDPGRLFGTPTNDPSSKPAKKFDVRADMIEALVIQGDEPVADRLVLRGAIELREVTRGEPMPVVIRGDLFELLDGASPHPRGALLGQPAEVIARGLNAHGERFHIYPVDNRLHILGPGDMTLTPPAGEKSTTTRRQPARINWKQQMEFDGQNAAFEGDVAVNTTQPTRDGAARCVALGDLLRAQLSRRIDFREPQVDGAVELAELTFEGWAFLEVDLVDTHGNRKLSEQMQVRDLAFNQLTGDIHGQGPGWLRGIHRGRDVLSHAPDAPAALPISTSGLNFLRVDFEQTLAGNLHHRQLEFLRGTKTLYGPVDSWEKGLDQLPDGELPSQAVKLTCQRLAVAQQDGANAGDQIELEATGNAYVQGNSFQAVGNRIAYSRAKDLLILEGDGRTRAMLAFRKSNGAPESKINAGAIMYCPSTRHYKVLNLGTSEVNVSQLRQSQPLGVAPR